MLLRSMIAAALALVLVPAADARPRTNNFASKCNVSMPCIGVERAAHARRTAAPRGSVSLAGVVATLAAKVRAIVVACPGTAIISTLRQTRRPGGSWSMHASGRAVDVRGNYACIYAQLRDWPDFSTDGARCRHVHISYGGGEGRFRHRWC